ncbi:MAG: 16S rRNA (guanine(527)-N(7))-methyltransferase RsmG [Burkholderiaceae bacterium]
MASSLATELREGAAALGLDLSHDQLQQLADYMALLQKWNRVYNLTAVREPAQMLRQHLLDSLAAVPPMQRMLRQRAAPAQARLLDVGSGGGLPGVVLAITCPELQVTCVDAVAKKAAFIRQAAVALQLRNLTSLHARVEAINGGFDVICSRAFAALPDFVRWTMHLVADGGCWMAMKGQHPGEEIAALPSTVKVFHVEQLSVPGLDAQRCIVWIEKLGDSAAQSVVRAPG